MRTGSESSRGFESGNRLLDSAGFLFHHAHVKDGYQSSKGCRFCKSGLEGISSEIELRDDVVQGDKVDEGGGTDGVGSTPPAPDSNGRPWWEQ